MTLARRNSLLFALLLLLAMPLLAVPGSWRFLGPDGGSVVDLAFAPSRPQALYAATAGGVFRSLDGGASWSESIAGLDAIPPVTSLAVDPVHPLTVYAAQNGAVFRSRDGGTAWLQVSSPFGVNRIVLPARGSAVYAASGGGLYRSDDGGTSWKILTRGLPASYRPITFVADPADPNRLYTIVMGVDSHVVTVFKSVDGGFNWKRSDQGIPVSQEVDALAIDPRSPNVLYAGLLNGRVYKSRDGGALWRPFGPPLGESVAKLWVDPAGGVFAATVDRLFHIERSGKAWTDTSQGLPETPVVSALIFPSKNPRSPLAAVYTYGGSRRGGVFASSNGGASWVLRSKGLSALDVTSVAVAPGALWAIGNEILFKSTDRGETWKRIRFEPVGLTILVAVDPAAPETVYAELFDFSLWRSRDGGESWERIGETRSQVSRLVFGPGSPSTLYAAGTGLLKSTDGGTTWIPLLDALVYDLEIAPSTPTTLYAAVQIHNPAQPFQLLRSTDGGSTWVSMPTVDKKLLTTLAVDPGAPETLYTTLEGRIYRSTDGGTSWSPYGNYFQFPAINLYPLLFPASPAALHVGVWLDNVYRLVDGGDPNSWEPLGKSPGHLRFNVLAADPQDPCRIYAATDSRGLLAFTESGTAACP
jgi:photosystem II stability/assembly factor-like uncharacterized protein